MAGIGNLYSVILLRNLTLSTVVTSSLELYILSLYSGALATHWSPCFMNWFHDGLTIYYLAVCHIKLAVPYDIETGIITTQFPDWRRAWNQKKG